MIRELYKKIEVSNGKYRITANIFNSGKISIHPSCGNTFCFENSDKETVKKVCELIIQVTEYEQ